MKHPVYSVWGYNRFKLHTSTGTLKNMCTFSKIFNTVLEDVRQQASYFVLIDACSGCGKTFLLHAILSAVRSSEPTCCFALAMATTGIASNLLKLGCTFHSRMKATEDSMLKQCSHCVCAGKSQLAGLE